MTPNSTILKIGLTGGIGSGKSTVSQMLTERGAAVIDADLISRQVTSSAGSAIAPIAKTFGHQFITSEGALDRERMRAHVFSSPSARQQLEAIIHPLVAEETQRLTQDALNRGFRTLVFDVPLLVEAGSRWRKQVDRVLLIDCSIGTQIKRVRNRSQLDENTVRRIIDSQASRQARLAASDWVIHNDGVSLEMLHSLVSKLPLSTS